MHCNLTVTFLPETSIIGIDIRSARLSRERGYTDLFARKDLREKYGEEPVLFYCVTVVAVVRTHCTFSRTGPQKRLRFLFFDPSWGASTSLCSGCCNNPALMPSSALDISSAGSEGVSLGALSIVGEGFSCWSKFAILSSNSLTAASCVRFSSSRIWTRSLLSIASFSARAFSSRIFVLSSSDLRFCSSRLDSSSGPVFMLRLVHLDDSFS